MLIHATTEKVYSSNTYINNMKILHILARKGAYFFLTVLYYRIIPLYRNNIAHGCKRTILELFIGGCLSSRPLFILYKKKNPESIIRNRPVKSE